MKKLRALRTLILCVSLLALSTTWGCGDDDTTSDPPANNNPTNNGTNNPTNNGTNNPTNNGTNNPTNNGTNNPTNNGTNNPTNNGTNNPTCTDDANSPNHTPESATSVALGSTLEDLQICSGADDWYAIDLPAGASIQAGIFFTTADGDLDFYIYDADTAEPFDGSEGTDDSEVIEFTATEAGTYYLQVVGFEGAANAYTLAVVQECNLDGDCGEGLDCVLSNAGGGFCSTFEPPTCGQGDAGEPNNTSSTATAATLTGDAFTATGLSICTADLDIYAITLAAPGTLTATVTPSTAADMDVYIVNATTGEYVGAGITEGTTPDTGVAAFVPAGTYHVRAALYEAPTADITYDLSVTFDGALCAGFDDCADTFGRSFCMADGTCGVIDGQGGVELGGACDDAEDCDADAAGCYTGSATPEGWVCTIVCDVDADCAALGAGAYCDAESGACLPACTTDGQCTAEQYCDAAGSCESRACVLDADCAREGESCIPDAFGEGLCGVFAPASCGQAEPSEPNDTNSNAEVIALVEGAATLTGLAICDEDVDTFAVDLTAASTLTVSAAYTGPADLDIYILEAATGRVVGAGASSEETSESGAAEFIAAGSYLIRVVAYPGDEATAETYTLNVTAAAAACATDADCESTSVLRLTCDAGACVDFQGAGAVALGGACDTSDDCVEDAELCYNAAGTPATDSNICTVTCGADADCAAIADTVCVAAGFFGFCLPPQ